MSDGDAGTGDGQLTVVVLNYNGRPLLETMLASIVRQTCEGFRTVVVDNGSSDDSLDFLAVHWPTVTVLALKENVGVTAALNMALRSAASEYVALFNNDMELERDCLEEMMRELLLHPEAGSTTPKMLDFADRAMLDGAGDMLNWRGGGHRRGHGTPDVGQYDRAEEVFGPCGGAALYRRTALDLVGGFDEAYFAYYEDIDWAFRAQLLGFRCRYVPSAVLYHRGSATLGRGMSEFNGYHLWRNPIWLIVKCYPAGALLRHAPALMRGQAGNLSTALREGRLRTWMRSMRDGLAGLPAAVRKRREIQRTRVISPAELEAVARITQQR